MKTLYIVEKDPRIIDMLRGGADWSALSVELIGESSDGEHALEEVLRLQPDLLMLDPSLPRISGADFLSRARLLGFTGTCILLLDMPSYTTLQHLLPFGVRCCLTLPDDLPQLQTRMKELLLCLQREHSLLSMVVSSAATSDTAEDVLPAALRFAQNTPPASSSDPSSRITVLDELLLYIETHYSENLKLELIAPLCGYSSAYLGKIFTQRAGESFNSYVDHCRIRHAKEFLKNEKWKVYEVAAQVGYRSVDYFHKKFHHYVGMSPLEYRRRESGASNVSGKPGTSSAP